MNALRLLFLTSFLFLFLVSGAQNTFHKTYKRLKYNSCPVSKNIDTELCFTCLIGDTLAWEIDNYFIFKTDTNGEIVFSKKLWLSHYVYVIHSFTNVDGSVIIFGGTNNGQQLGYDDLFIFKMTENGIVEWSYLYSVGGLILNIVEADNGYYMAGIADKDVSGNLNDILVVRINYDGELIWAKRYGLNIVEQGCNLFADNQGKVTVCGKTVSAGAGAYDAMLLSLDSVGNILWSKTYGEYSDEQPYYIRQNSQKEFIVAGYSFSYSLDQLSDIYVFKTDSVGNLIWSKTYGGAGADGFEFNSSASGISNKHRILAATDSYGFGSSDILLMELDNEGDIVFAKCYGSPINEVPQYLCEDANNLYLPGISITDSDSMSQYLIKTDLFGNSGCREMDVSPMVTDVNTVVTDVFPEVRTGGTRDTLVVLMTDVIWTDSLLCKSVGIEEIKLFDKFKIYPNPNNGLMQMDYQLPQGSNGIVQLLDFNGRELQLLNLYEGLHTLPIDISKYGSGMYFARLFVDGEYLYSEKIVLIQ